MRATRINFLPKAGADRLKSLYSASTARPLESEQMIQFPTISPAKGHLASILSTHLTAGADFSVAPEITANLVEMVEIGSNNLTQKAASSLWMDAGEFRQREFESISKSRFV